MIAIFVLGLCAPTTAWAGSFGGFSRDGTRYLDGTDLVCAPVGAKGGAPACRRAQKDEVTRLGFKKGTLQRGTGAKVVAEVAGGGIAVRDSRSKKLLVEWKATDPVSRVLATHLADGGKLVAVEYEARLGGRTGARTVVLAVPGVAPGAATAPQPATTPATVLSPADAKALAQAIKSAAAELKRKRWAKAEAGYRKALALAGDHAAARFGLAAALARLGRRPEAIAELRLLARSAVADAPELLVEARSSAHFAAFKEDPDFRRAVGIDKDPDRPPTAYERLVGAGGQWEQPGQSCQSPTVALKLDRKTKKFALSIRVRCQGEDEITRLGGTWAAAGSDRLALTFPNASGPDEKLDCKLSEDAGEDLLSCTLEDILMSLRIVRR
jgi:hypothetical protein